MTKNNVNDYVDGFFVDTNMTNDLYLLRETIINNINEKLWKNINNGLAYGTAFDKAISDSGDIDNMIEKQIEISNIGLSKKELKESKLEIKPIPTEPNKKQTFFVLVSLLAYLSVGFNFGGWNWGWIIIPISAITFSNMKDTIKVIALTPFVIIMIYIIASISIIFY